MQEWAPPIRLTPRDERLVKLAARSRKLFGFLRTHRHEIFNEAFQEQLAGMYRETGQGREPRPPALMCMALLLQAYLQTSDAETVRLTGSDQCWRMVLDTLSESDRDEPAFSQGTLQQFRERLIKHDMDLRLLERTLEIARETRGFDWKKTPGSLRVGVDSRPLAGAGRVEDTFNLLGHAGRKIVEGMARELDIPFEDVCIVAGAPLLLASSIKAGLDVDWNDATAKNRALNRLCRELESLRKWVESRSRQDGPGSSIGKYLQALEQVWAQDLESDGESGWRIRQGVAPDRRISIEDADMRHGRKSASQRISGYKQHVEIDLDTQLFLACNVTSANRPEEEATKGLERDLARQAVAIGETHIDRAYIKQQSC